MLKLKPVTGMRDIMPGEMIIRDWCTAKIKETYRKYGFTPIDTPSVESYENLHSKEGGDNEKLIFGILKRGEKLNLSEAKTEADVSDSGLRYDLTVPLVRYYSCHREELPSPFKALQIGNVWRADRPQRGRFRQFTQCDIDILGDPTNFAETELILATSEALCNLGFSGFSVRINDRRLLKATALWAGFPEESLEQVFITLDKMDKAGEENIPGMLEEEGFDRNAADKWMKLYSAARSDSDPLGLIERETGDLGKDAGIENLREIMDCVKAAGTGSFTLDFDLSLVRGMSYYTGTIFEIAMPEYGGSCGGGGRYDEMVSRFSGQSVPACGFSIGFERIIMLLMEKGFRVPGSGTHEAWLIEKGISPERLSEIMKEAAVKRSEGCTVLTTVMKKNKKFQKEQLTALGYEEIREIFRDR